MPRRVYNRVYSPDIWEKVNPQSKELLEDYLMDMKVRKLSPLTVRQYFIDLRGFLCHLYSAYSNRFVLELSKKELRNYAISLSDERNLSNARRNCLTACLKSMLEYAEFDDDWGYELNASRIIKGLSKEPVKPIIFLEDSIVMKLFDTLMGLDKFQQATILMLSYESAARRAELAQVEKESFLNPLRNNTNIVIGKGKKKFSLLYFDLTKTAAASWLKKRGDDNIRDLFIAGMNGDRHEADPMDVYRMFTDMRKYLDLPDRGEIDFSTHSMRHSALANYKDGTHHICRDLGKPGFTLDQLQILAHHDSVQNTQDYLPDTTNDELENMFDIKIQ